jgi:hypothetical protein
VGIFALYLSLDEVEVNKNHKGRNKKKMTKPNVCVVGLALAFGAVLPAARASGTDQATKLTFSQPVQIPGRVLPAGTYCFVVEPTPGSKIVRIFNSDESILYASLLTVSAEQQQPVDKTEITFAARAGMQPEAILTWFYPGRTIGHQFIYPKQEKELARDKQHVVVTGY